MRDRTDRSGGDRLLEVPLGVLLGVVALVPIVFVAGAVLSALDSGLSWPMFLGVAMAIMAFLWCARTSWRLVSGRARADGGLLSPWLVIAAGVGFAAWGIVGLAATGAQGIGGAAWMGGVSIGCFVVARHRLKRSKRSQERAA